MRSFSPPVVIRADASKEIRGKKGTLFGSMGLHEALNEMRGSERVVLSVLFDPKDFSCFVDVLAPFSLMTFQKFCNNLDQAVLVFSTQDFAFTTFLIV